MHDAGTTLKDMAKTLRIPAQTFYKHVKKDAEVADYIGDVRGRRSKPLDPDIREIILNMLKTGLSFRQISEEVGIPISTISRICAQDNELSEHVKPSCRPKIYLTNEEKEKIRTLSSYGLGVTWIARAIGRTPAWLRSRIKDEDDDELKTIIEEGFAKGATVAGKQLYTKMEDGDLSAIKYFENTRLDIIPKTSSTVEQKVDAQVSVSKYDNMSEEELEQEVARLVRKQVEYDKTMASFEQF